MTLHVTGAVSSHAESDAVLVLASYQHNQNKLGVNKDMREYFILTVSHAVASKACQVKNTAHESYCICYFLK
jgi:hypothetical protein